MKDIIIKHKAIFALVLFLLIILVIFGIGNTVVTTIDPTASTTVLGVPSTATKPVTAAPKPATTGTQTSTTPKPAPAVSYGKSLPITVSKSVNEDEYIKQLLANQRTCEQLAEKQVDAIYGNSLQSMNFEDYYTTSTGKCYAQIFGKTTEKYATSSVGHIYLRDVLSNVLLAECISPTGGKVTDPQWSCTIKATGQKLDKTKFDDYFNGLIS